MTLKAPKLEGTTLTFDVAVLEGSLTARAVRQHFSSMRFGGASGPRGGGFHGGYAHVGYGATRMSGYAAAPTGMLLSIMELGMVLALSRGRSCRGCCRRCYRRRRGRPYTLYPPYCGYYPYPPCY